jgi:hypothetical protein
MHLDALSHFLCSKRRTTIPFHPQLNPRPSTRAEETFISPEMEVGLTIRHSNVDWSKETNVGFIGPSSEVLYGYQRYATRLRQQAELNMPEKTAAGNSLSLTSVNIWMDKTHK